VGGAGEGAVGFADQALDAAELSAALGPLLATARWLLVGTIPLASPAAASALQLACRQAAAAGVALALDVNWRPTFWDPAADPASGPTPAQIAAITPLLHQAALLKCAAEEARWLFGSDDPAVVRAALPQHPDVVVTDGGAPLRWCFAGRSGELPAFRVPVVDTTGAGDAFTAGLLHGLLHNQVHGAAAIQPEPLLRFASACGALVCQGAGAIDPQPSADAVCAFLAAN
jgi:fructokinase